MGRSFDSHPLVEGYGTSCRGAPEFCYCRHNDLLGVSHLLHMTFVLGLCGSLCHPCFVKPAPSCESACSPSYRTLVLFLADM